MNFSKKSTHRSKRLNYLLETYPNTQINPYLTADNEVGARLIRYGMF
mgnify:CR=1 FL=1